MFFRGSRYEHIPDTSLVTRDGRRIAYKRMRFIPRLNTAPRLLTKAQPGDRPDLVAFRALGDPEQFWRLCDVNAVQSPVDLAPEPGRNILVPTLEGGG
jgi:hypothetical protein